MDKDNNEITFNSIKEAAKELNLSEKNIVYHCNRGKGKYNLKYG